jgi:hypothetical protein
VSLAIAVVLGVGAAIAYGAATAGEHTAAHTGTGAADARGLVRLLRDPRWLLSMGGDTVGLGLHAFALVAGPVVLIQPLLVLALPVSLPIAWAMGGRKPQRGDYFGCVAILGGLVAFFVFIGDPGPADIPTVSSVLIASVVSLLVGGTACFSVRHGRPVVRAIVYGTVAGAWFGLVGVLMDGVAQVLKADGLGGLTHADGLTPLLCLVIIGTLSMTLTQIAFQIGDLGASFPANLAADPLIAVILGVLLVHEDVPISAALVIGYAACLGAILAGAIKLANPPIEAAPEPEPSRDDVAAEPPIPQVPRESR